MNCGKPPVCQPGSNKFIYSTVCCFSIWLNMSNSLRPHCLQHTRLPYLSPSPRVFSNSWQSSQCCHLTISSSAVSFSSYPQSFPTSGSFLVHGLFTSVAKVLELQFQYQSSNEYPGLIPFKIDWFDSLTVQGTLKSLTSATVQKHQIFGAQSSLWSNSHIHTWLLKNHST